MGSFDPNFFYIPDDEEIDNVFPVEEQESFRQSYSFGDGSRNNLGGAFSYVQSDPLTVSGSVLVPPPRLSVAALDPMDSFYVTEKSMRATEADNSPRHHKVLPTLRVRPARA